jgi:hypothetical protein
MNVAVQQSTLRSSVVFEQNEIGVRERVSEGVEKDASSE